MNNPHIFGQKGGCGFDQNYGFPFDRQSGSFQNFDQKEMGRARDVEGSKGMGVDGMNFHSGKRDFNEGYNQGRGQGIPEGERGTFWS